MGSLNLVIQKGYKQSETGIIPDNWNVKRIIDIAPLQRGFDLPTPKLVDGSFPVVYSNGILNYHNQAMAKGPGVVTGRSGTIGNVTYVESDYWPHNTSLWVTNFKGNNEKFIYYLYKSLKLERFGTGSGVPTLNRNDVHSYKVAIPEQKAEQSAIATALSDIDNLIEGLQKLITKKRMIKQGAMQELLTGKKRLPGFSGKWMTKKLGELCDIIGGGTPSTVVPEYWNGNIYWCIPTDITDSEGKYLFSTERCISDAGLKFSAARLLPAGTLLLCSRATIGEIKIAGIPVSTNQGFKSLICKEGIDNEFLFYKMLTMKSKLLEKAIGSTFLEISKRDTASLELEIPPNKAEQSAIAETLSDMDTEIEMLRQNEEKYLNLKQGMMQVLLTGKVRLV